MSEPRAGVRRAERPTRRRPSLPRMPGAAAGALVVLAAAVVLVLVTPSGPPATPRPPAVTGEAVTETTLACPPPRSAPARGRTSFGAALAAIGDLDAGGEVDVEPGSPVTLPRGGATEIDSSTDRGPVVRGYDGAAQGLLAWRADTGPSLAVLDCQGPRASWWFSGAGAGLDHESRLILTNVDSGPAVVDLRALSPDGEADLTESGGQGLEVAPGATVAVSLVDLAPQSDELSLWVHATRGRVVAAVHDRYASSPTARPGYEWMPAQTAPARVVRLAGVARRARSRTLLVGNPSALESVLQVEVAGLNGRFAPADLEQLRVEPGGVETVDLSSVLEGEPFGVRVRASRPVVAALRSVRRSGDQLYAGAAQPLRGPAALPALRRATVQLTGGSNTTRAAVTAYTSSGAPAGSTRLSLAAFATGTWDVPGRAAYVVVEPVQGRPYGAVVYANAAAVPLRELPVSLRIPVVRPAF